jgi:membrane protein implicated in regulation of membrane protease activity
MQTLFMVCFGVGVGFTAIGFLLGEFGDGSDSFGANFPLRPVVISIFLTAFGGLGLIMLSRLNLYAAFTVATVISLGLAFCFHRFIIVPLYKAQSTSSVDKQSLIGHTATVTETIPQGGYGKISYVIHGNTHAAPAKSEDGNAIARRELVEIVYIEKNTHHVRRK